MEVLRSSKVWAETTGVVVMDPDGWDRRNFEASWNEPISIEEFRRRVWHSTIDFRTLKGYLAEGL